MKQTRTTCAVIFMAVLLLCIHPFVHSQSKAAVAVIPVHEKVLTAADQKALTPDMVIQSLKEGNKRFVNNNLTYRNHSAMGRKAAAGLRFL